MKPYLLSTDQYLTNKRSGKKLKRKRKASLRAERRALVCYRFSKQFGTHSKLISLMSKSFRGKPAKHTGFLKLSIPECFSIIDDPETAIATLGQFAKTYQQNKPHLIEIDHSVLANYDLAANGILDLIAVEAIRETKLQRVQLKWKGIFPRNKDIRRFIRGVGIIKHLKITKEYPREEEAAALNIFDVRNRHYYVSNPNKADKKSIVTADFVDHINTCLGVVHRHLTPIARHKLCQYISEILDNVEQHAGMVDWTIQGYLDNSCDLPICEIAIFNFGKTIAENLGSVSRSSYTWKQIGHYVLTHQARRFFGPTWSESNLLTLIALQEKVSSKNFTESDTRGHGSVDLIEFFQKIYEESNNFGDKKAKMAIVSGNTHITFDGKYTLSSVGDAPRRIAFNATNDLLLPPDNEYVRSLKGLHFPGTIISIKFPLDVRSVPQGEAIVNESSNSN